jgi:hypothetical protein
LERFRKSGVLREEFVKETAAKRPNPEQHIDAVDAGE